MDTKVKEKTKLESIFSELSNLDVEITTAFSVVNGLFEEFEMEEDGSTADCEACEPEKLDKLEEILMKIKNKKEKVIELRGLISQFKSRI